MDTLVTVFAGPRPWKDEGQRRYDFPHPSSRPKAGYRIRYPEPGTWPLSIWISRCQSAQGSALRCGAG